MSPGRETSRNQDPLASGNREVKSTNSMAENSKNTGNNSKLAHNKTSINDKLSSTSSQELNPAEKDDDSPYFVKIILDPQFLSYLEDANLIDPSEIKGPPDRIQLIMDNKVYQDIVNKEVYNMFYRNTANEKAANMKPIVL